MEAARRERRAAGFAFPALGEACADVSYDCRPDIVKFLGAIFADSMVVFDPGKEKVCAAWGEFMALVARNNACRGVVVDGTIRDAEMIASIHPMLMHGAVSSFWARTKGTAKTKRQREARVRGRGGQVRSRCTMPWGVGVKNEGAGST